MAKSYTSQYVNVNGVRLRYLDWGTVGKKPLICLHGNTRQAHIWDEFSEVMSAHYQVYALDQRGHGESDWAADGYHRDKYVADLAAFMDELSIDKVVLVGLSMGGWNSLLYAADNPKRVERFIMVDIGPEGSAKLKEARPSWKPAPLEMDSFESALDWARGNDPWSTEERRRKDVTQRIRQHSDGVWRWKCDPAILTYHLLDNVEPEYIDRYWRAMKKVQCPFMEVRGKESITLGDETIEKMKKANSFFSSVDVEDAGHEVTVDKPYDFIAVTKDFLSVNKAGN
jgi:pimeloyl-ACP methyl ester carboxylesterase